MCLPESYKLVALPENEIAIEGNDVLGYEDQMVTIEVGTDEKVTKDLKRRPPTPQ
jgi:hypothetical protein